MLKDLAYSKLTTASETLIYGVVRLVKKFRYPVKRLIK